MRISDTERSAIVSAVRQADSAAEVWLIGSRADDRLRGGDIDLLVVSSRIDFGARLDILTDIKIAIGDQKIDLTVITPDEKSDPFASSVLPKAVRL